MAKLHATTAVDQDFELIPDDVYAAQVEDVEQRQTMQMNDKGEMEPSDFLIWKFGLTEDETWGGRYVWCTSSTKLSPKSKAGPWVEAILGRPLGDEDIDTDDLLGMPCRVHVRIVPDKKNPGQKRNTVESVLAARKPANGRPTAIGTPATINEREALVERHEKAVRALGWSEKQVKMFQLEEDLDDLPASKLPIDQLTKLVELEEAKVELEDTGWGIPQDDAEDELDKAGLVSASPGPRRKEIKTA
jgi:hypothetical protein